MSGHLRVCFVVCVLFAGVSTAAASSNPFADFFGQTAPAQPTAQAPAEQAPAEKECLSRPGKSAVPGQHWFYHSDGHRKCWFQAAEGTAPSKKPVRARAAKHAAAPREIAPNKRGTVADARDELQAPAQTPEPPPPRAPEIKVVDAAALAPAVPVVASPARDELAPAHPTPPQVNVEKLLAAAPPTTDANGTYALPPPAIAAATAEVGKDGRWSTASWLGLLLMALGLVSLLSTSRILRRAAPVSLETDLSAIACDDTGNVLQARPDADGCALLLRHRHRLTRAVPAVVSHNHGGSH